MDKPPPTIDGADVLRYSFIDERHRHTGKCRQIVRERVMGRAAALAICQYTNESGFYLFSCDEYWKSVSDTWHETIADAMRQAEFEYEGVSATWDEARSK